MPDEANHPEPQREFQTDAHVLRTEGVSVSHAGERPAPPGLPQVPGYEVLQTLGRGGMGVVYKARHQRLNRIVALKMILHAGHASEEEHVRFLAEAEALAAIKHPGVVQVYDFGSHEGTPYFALELCEGGSLQALLSGKPLPPREAVDIVEQVARAVQSAHEKGIIHRDLKPANVLLVESAAEGHDGSSARGRSTQQASTLGGPDAVRNVGQTAKVTDFGLARRLDAGTGLTQSGAVMGTPSYMAPEQAVSSKNAGPPADIYSVGAILYECLTGRPPFVAATSFETLRQVVGSDPPVPRSLNPNVPRDLETIALKCLHKEPERRYESAQALADDLRRWSNGETIQARPAGPLERLVKWAKRRPVAAAGLLGGLLGVTAILFLALFASFQWRKAEQALQDRDAAELRRALSQVEALRDAAPGAVPGLVAGLEMEREEVLSAVRAGYGTEKGAKQARMGLALVGEPDVRAELLEVMMRADDPAEMLLIRDALVGHSRGLSEGLWKRTGQGKAEGFRALVALAAFDATNPRWKQEAPKLVDRLLNENRLHLGVWVAGLTPIRAALVEPLGVVFGDQLPEQRAARLAAAEVLPRYVADQPEALQELLLDADGQQYAFLRPLMEKHRNSILARMHAELAKVPDYWKDPPLDASWKLDAKVQAEVEGAGGMVAERWAMCQTLPMARLVAVTQAMGKAGYRPLCARPWSLGKPDAQARELSIALVWTRNGREWKLEPGLDLDALKQRDGEEQKGGFVPADLGAYATKEGVRYLGLWRRGDKGEKAVLMADIPEEKMLDETSARRKEGLVPLRVQSITDEKGQTRFSGVWVSRKDDEANVQWSDDEGKHAGHVADADRLLLDVDLRNAGLNRRYASAWSGDATRRAESLQGLSVEAHLGKGSELAAKGYRPVAVSLGTTGEKAPVAASVWHRPIVLADKATLARRQANAAAILLVLKEPGKVWEVFKHKSEPTSRSWLVWRAGEFESDAKQLIARLEVEKDTSVRRALILALGEYEEKNLPVTVREPLVRKLLGWYRDDPDPGIHGAISWLLRHKNEGPTPRPLDWGQAKVLEALDKELAKEKPRVVAKAVAGDAAGWYVNGQGQAMVLVKGPVDFAMGSRLWDPDRFAGNDRPHMRQIPRSFAISSTAVTVGQWERFLKDRPEKRSAYPKRYSPEDGGPIIFVTWYDAAEYCNWLSEREGIPEEEWVYPRKIGPGMKMPANYLGRTGYRLPTEAEMEFACKAGSEESRYCGIDVSLLPRYAHFLTNSKDRTWPFGQKRPNDLGLFDTHGNVWNWTLSPSISYPRRLSAKSPLDAEHRSDTSPGLDISTSRVLRGGSFNSHAPYVRASHRNVGRPGIRNSNVGFRACRTYLLLF